MVDVKDVLNRITQLDAYQPWKHPSPLERKIQRVSTYCFWAGVGLYLALAVLGAVNKVAFTLPMWLRTLAIMSLLVAVVLILSSMLVSMAASLFPLLRWRRWNSEALLDEFDNDHRHALGLADYLPESLAYVDDWLGQKMERAERRIALFFDKLAVVPLLLIATTQMKNLGDASSLPALFGHGFAGNSVWVNAAIMGVALILGLALGAFSLKARSNTLAYYRQLLQLALKIQASREQDSPASDSAVVES